MSAIALSIGTDGVEFFISPKGSQYHGFFWPWKKVVFGPEKITSKNRVFHGQKIWKFLALKKNGSKKRQVTAKIFRLFLALITPNYKTHGQKIDGQKKLTAKKLQAWCVVARFHGQKEQRIVSSRPKKLSICPYASAHARMGTHYMKSRNAHHAGA